MELSWHRHLQTALLSFSSSSFIIYTLSNINCFAHTDIYSVNLVFNFLGGVAGNHPSFVLVLASTRWVFGKTKARVQCILFHSSTAFLPTPFFLRLFPASNWHADNSRQRQQRRQLSVSFLLITSQLAVALFGRHRVCAHSWCSVDVIVVIEIVVKMSSLVFLPFIHLLTL